MAHTNIKLYGTNWCSDCKRSKKFLGEQRVHYDFIDIEEDLEGQAIVRELQKGGMSIPTIVFEDGSVLIEPSNAEVAAKLGLETKAKCEFYDLITVGGGPTALTTAIYAARDAMAWNCCRLRMLCRLATTWMLILSRRIQGINIALTPSWSLRVPPINAWVCQVRMSISARACISARPVMAPFIKGERLR